MPKWNAFKSNLSIVKECNGNILGNCWAKSGVSPDSAVNVCNVFYVSTQNSGKAFVTSNGMFWYTYSGQCDIIAVDVNGSLSPNKWGQDVFIFSLDDTYLKISNCDVLGNSAKFLYQ